MMKIVCISDTHCNLKKVRVPDGDLLIHSGDLTFIGDIREISQELSELGRIAKNFKHGCVFICGNHDWLGEHNTDLMKQIAIDNGLIYLDHSSTIIEGINFFGSPFTPEFGNWAYNVPRGQPLKNKWALIPENTDVLITHGPPKGVLDTVRTHFPIQNLGCQELTNRIKDLKNLKLHVFGHIHDSCGTIKIGSVFYINASVSTENYKPINKPFIYNL